MQVLTTKGLVPIEQLRIVDVVEIGENHRKLLMQYWLGDELVRQSAFIDVLRPLESESIQGNVNGQ